MNEKNSRACPACHNSARTELGEKNSFRMLVCKECSSIYSSYLPTGGDSEDYDEYYTETNLHTPDFVKKSVNEIIDSFAPFRTQGRMLDIGFGSANLMLAAREKNWNVQGMEVSKPAIEHARKMGFEVFHGELSDAQYEENYFDVVTASEIIEHCPQPEIMLGEVFRVLRPGGLFWATTPSAKSLSYQMIGLNWTVICPPEHLQLFSKKGMAMMFKKTGFSQVNIKTFGFNPFEVANHLRGRSGPKPETEGAETFDRVGTAYALNESMTKSPAKTAIKRMLNNTLNLLSIGDSLKIRAVK